MSRSLCEPSSQLRKANSIWHCGYGGKREPGSLSSESRRKISHFGVFLPARSAIPSCDQRFFDSHDTVKVGNKVLVGDFGDIGECGPFEATDLFHPNFACLDQGRNLNERPCAASADDIASLAELHHAMYCVQYDRGAGLDAPSNCHQSVGCLIGGRTMRTQKIGEMNKLQSDVQRDISLTPDLESVIHLLFVLFGQGHETLACRLGCPLATDRSRHCWNFWPILFSLQKKRGRLRLAHVPSNAGKGDTLKLQFRNAICAPHGFREAAILKQVKPGDAHALVNVQERSTITLSVAPIKMPYRRKHSSDHSIMPRGH